jgi:hypothetical protein
MKLVDRVVLLVTLLVWCGFLLPWFKFPSDNKATHLTRTQIQQEMTRRASQPWWELWFGIASLDRKQTLDEVFEGNSGWELYEGLDPQKPRHKLNAGVSQLYMNGTRSGDKRFFFFGGVVASAFAVIFVLGCRKTRWPLALPMLLCLVIYAWARWKMQAVALDQLTSGLHTGPGLWLTLFGLLALAMLLLLKLVIPSR